MLTATLQDPTEIQTQILDELSDGQWYPLYKITKKIERGSDKAKIFKEKLARELDLLVDKNILISGGSDSYRFNSEKLEMWRTLSSNPKIHTKQYQPRYFGGILEDEGWLLAELKFQDLIHFRAEPTLTREILHSVVGGKKSRIQIDEGLYRVFCTNGEETFDLIKDLKETHPHHEIRGMRLEKNLRRRELDDLPPMFVNDLSKYYGQFAKVLLRGYMSSVTKHISDPDDIQQQIYIWVLDAIQRYDAETSIPFAAYLSTSLAKWVFNLNRKAYGRAVADVELKHSRITNEFRLEHGRDPKPEEIAEILGVEVSSVKDDLAIISTVTNLRNIGTINRDDEDYELPLPAKASVEDNIDRLVNNMLLSASLVTATKSELKNTKGLNGLIGIYYETWGAENASKKTRTWVKSAAVQDSIKKVMDKAKDILEKERK